MAKSYSDGERRSNGTKIINVTLAVLGLGVIVTLLNDASLGKLLGFAVFVVLSAAVWWWLFASKSSRPLQLQEGEYLPPEYGTIKKMIKAYRRR